MSDRDEIRGRITLYSVSTLAEEGDSARFGGAPERAPSRPDTAAWEAQVSEQLEELGWTAGLLHTLGDRFLRAEGNEARSFGMSLVKHAETLVRLKEGALAYTQRIGGEKGSRAAVLGEWIVVLDGLQRCGDAMIGASQGYANIARHLPAMDGELRTAVGEALIISRLVEERGGQMRRLAERLRNDREPPSDPTHTAASPTSRENSPSPVIS